MTRLVQKFTRMYKLKVGMEEMEVIEVMVVMEVMEVMMMMKGVYVLAFLILKWT